MGQTAFSLFKSLWAGWMQLLPLWDMYVSISWEFVANYVFVFFWSFYLMSLAFSYSNLLQVHLCAAKNLASMVMNIRDNSVSDNRKESSAILFYFVLGLAIFLLPIASSLILSLPILVSMIQDWWFSIQHQNTGSKFLSFTRSW